MNHIAQDEGGKKKNEGIEPWARKKKSTCRCSILSSSFPGKYSPFSKPSAQRYPATCRWLTGTDQSCSHICPFHLTWEIKKAEGKRDKYTKDPAVVLEQNSAENTHRNLRISFFYICHHSTGVLRGTRYLTSSLWSCLPRHFLPL